MNSDITTTLRSALRYQKTGQLLEAEREYRTVLEKTPNDITANHLMSLLFLHSGRHLEALRYVRRAVELSGNRADTVNTQALICQAAGAVEEAEEMLRSLVKQLPDNLEGLVNLGALLIKLGNFDEAVAYLTRSLTLKPNNIVALFQRALAYVALEDWDRSIMDFRLASDLEPNDASIRHNLALALHQGGQLTEAVDQYRNALAAGSSTPAESIGGLADALLLLGRYKEGWAAYESRRLIPNWIRATGITRLPAWEGDALDGRKLLVYSEQGIGDLIQFSRYLLPLAKLNRGVGLKVPKRIVPLMRSLSAEVAVVSDTDEIHDYDCHVAVMSLPHFTGLVKPYWPKCGAYLHPAADRFKKWQGKVRSDRHVQIAIIWRGSVISETRRDIPLVAFRHIAEIPNVQLISLQKDVTNEERLLMKKWGNVTDLGDQIDHDSAFVDSIAILHHMDLMITSDTGPAHLGGASGIPVWTALMKIPEWRWGLAGDFCPWYPTMRLFRQSNAGGWDEVLAAMAKRVRVQWPQFDRKITKQCK